MIKHDAIPRYFKHRYLLSDFGWVPMDPLDGRSESCLLALLLADLSLILSLSLLSLSPLLVSGSRTSGNAFRNSDLILETRGGCKTCDRLLTVSS
jgi:hypothetical protein